MTFRHGFCKSSIKACCKKLDQGSRTLFVDLSGVLVGLWEVEVSRGTCPKAREASGYLAHYGSQLPKKETGAQDPLFGWFRF